MPRDDPAIPVAAYLRAAPATADRAALETFAAAHCMAVVRWFEDDEAHDAHRPALAVLMAAAASPGRDFEFVLTPTAAQLDRDHPGDWQARDAALRACGCPPLYTAEPQRNDGRAIGRRLKALYAEDYALDRRAALSRRIADGQRRRAAQGFHIAGPAVFGLRRQMIGWNQAGRVMQWGEGRPSGRYRSVLVHGPDAEVDAVRRVFALYARQGLTARAIARRLNAEQAAAERHADALDPARDPRIPPRPWTQARVLRMLENEIYAGVRTLGRRIQAGDAAGRRSRRPVDAPGVLRIEAACQPIVSRPLWEAAQARRHGRKRRFTDAEILAGLERVLKTHGVITRELVDTDPELPGWITVGTRFGGREKAFAAIGYAAPGQWEARRAMGRVRGACNDRKACADAR